MAYFLAPPLVRLRHEINTLWPDRDRSSDGWIGDTSHQARPSDHNPDYADGGIVRAYDIDEDLVAGLTAAGEAMPLVNQIIRDPRVAYVIYEGRIWQNPAVFKNGGWQPYTGVNAHRHHIHVSMRRGAHWDRDGSPWGLVASTSHTSEALTWEDILANLSTAELKALMMAAVNEANGTLHTHAMIREVPIHVWGRRIQRIAGIEADDPRQPSALQELADVWTKVHGAPAVTVDVDEVELAASLAPLLTANAVAGLPEDQLARLAKLVNDEADERARRRLDQ